MVPVLRSLKDGRKARLMLIGAKTLVLVIVSRLCILYVERCVLELRRNLLRPLIHRLYVSLHAWLYTDK